MERVERVGALVLLAVILPVIVTAQPLSPLTLGLGVLEARVRILSHNVLGSHDLLANDHLCRERYTRLGAVLSGITPAFDVIGLQEYFSTPLNFRACDPDPLRETLTAEGRYLTTASGPCHLPFLFPIARVNGCLFKPTSLLGANGGVGLITSHRIEDADWWKWDEGTGQARAQGILFVRVRLEGTLSAAPIQLDVYVLHLHSAGEGCNLDCQTAGLAQVARRAAERSQASGNPVLVMGDFNIPGPTTAAELQNAAAFPQYQRIMRELRNPRDLWLEAHPNGPPEHGFTGDECPIVRSVFDSPELDLATFQCSGSTTMCGCRGRRIDYVFVLTDPRFTTSPHQVRIAHSEDVEVVRWFKFATEGGPHRIVVSDHYGVAATLEIRKPPVVKPVAPTP